jgi:hypothetical protein
MVLPGSLNRVCLYEYESFEKQELIKSYATYSKKPHH